LAPTRTRASGPLGGILFGFVVWNQLKHFFLSWHETSNLHPGSYIDFIYRATVHYVLLLSWFVIPDFRSIDDALLDVTD
jgi:hypothetical protein